MYAALDRYRTSRRVITEITRALEFGVDDDKDKLLDRRKRDTHSYMYIEDRLKSIN